MAKRAPAVVTPNVTVKVSGAPEDKPESKPEESGDDEQRQAAEDIALAHQEAVRGSVAWIYRIDKGGRKSYVGEAASHRISQSFLLDSLGGGHFEVEHRRPREKGGGTVRDSVDQFYIDEKSNPPKTAPWSVVEKPAEMTDPARGAIGPNIIEAGVLSMLQQQQQMFQQQQALQTAGLEQARVHSQMQLELMRASIAAKPDPAPPKEDRTVETIAAIVTPIVTAVTGIITAVVSRPQPNHLHDFAEIAAAVKPPPAPPADATQLGSLISALNGLAHLKDKIGGGNGAGVIDTGNPILDTVRDVARAIPEVASAAKVAMAQRQATLPPPGVTETLQAAPGGPQGAPPGERRALSPGPGEPMGPPRTATTPTAPQPTTVPESNGAQTDDAMLKAFLAPISAEVIQLAKANRDPRRIASAFLDLQEKYIEQIAWWVEQPNCLQNFLRDFPEWSETPELKRWLEEFIQTIDRETHEAPQS